MKILNKKQPTITLLMAIYALIPLFCKSQTNVVQSSSYDLAKQMVWVTDEQQVQGDKNTNGWSCMMSIGNQAWLSSQMPPVCSVKIQNISTNTLYCWVGFYGETYSKINLLNSKDEPVEKTDDGKQIGTRTSDAQIKSMVKARFKQWVNGEARTPGYIPVKPGKDCGIGFSIPQLFELKEPGEYTLKVQTCLIQKIGGEENNPQLKITWVPQVTAKVQIRREDIETNPRANQGITNANDEK